VSFRPIGEQFKPGPGRSITAVHALSGKLHVPVIITMITMRMMQPAVYEIVDMVAVRHRFVSAVWTVRMRATDVGRALHGICGVDRDGVLIHVILVHMMEMAIVQIVDVIVVANRSVSAVRAMLVRVVGVVFLGTCRHGHTPSDWLASSR
jgi:hypothetical protein